MSEEWVKWKPIENLPSRMYIERLVNDKNGTLLVFHGEEEGSNPIKVLFENSILSLRSTDEGRRLRTINYLEEKYGANFYTKWVFFKVSNSDYIQWFHQETYDMYANHNIEHYVFLTSDDVVEVLSTYAPEVNVT